MAFAETADGAEQTVGRLLVTYGGSQFHHSLIVVAGSVGIEKVLHEIAVGLGGVGRVLVVSLVSCNTGEDTNYVSIDNGCLVLEGNTADRRSGVGPDSGEGEPAFGVCRELVLGDGCDFLCEFMEISSSGIVAEAFPALEDLFFGSRCERLEVRVGFQPCVKVG